MNNLERYLDQVIEQRPEIQELPPEEPASEPSPSFLKSLRRRWYIVLVIVILVCGIGLPIVWSQVKPLYVVRGALRIDPAVENLLTGEREGGDVPYPMEMNQLAMTMLQGERLSAIVDELEGQNLKFFSGKPRTLVGKLKAKVSDSNSVASPREVIKSAAASEIITVTPMTDSGLMAVKMKSDDLKEAKTIVNAILNGFKSTYGTNRKTEGFYELESLKDEKEDIEGRIATKRGEIRTKAEEFGTTVVDPFQEMELQVQTVLRTRLIGLKAEIIRANANVELLRKDVRKADGLSTLEDVNLPSAQLVAMTQEYVNNDPMIQQLKANVLEMERDLIVSRRSLQPDNPTLKQKEDLLADFTKALDERTKDLQKEFEDGLADRRKAVAQQKLERAEAELRSLKAQEADLEEALDEQSRKTVAVGQKGLDLSDDQFELNMLLEYRDTITRRMTKLRLDQEQQEYQGRVRDVYEAQYLEMEDNRVKMAMTVIFGALAGGCALAFLRDKMDKTLQTPDDVTRYLGLPLLGTTTSSRAVKATRFAEQIAGDYQTIRANLGLLSNEGIPRRLVVGSPGMREGKTTFAVNLASSLAKSGKRVLLIDGDLRKPDVGNMLGVPSNSGGVQEVLLGEDPSRLVYSVPESGLHVLAANPRSLADVYELLASSTAAQQMDRLSREYDHVIVDTPPALAFPDALVWAKMTDAAILVGFAGQTTAPDLKEAKERFKRARVQVLGAILSNVTTEHSLYRYGYGYRAGEVPASPRSSRHNKKLMLPAHGRDGGTGL